GAVQRARDPARAPAVDRRHRPGDGRHRLAVRPARRGVGAAGRQGLPARRLPEPPVLLAGAGRPLGAGRRPVARQGLAGRRPVDGGPVPPGRPGLPAGHAAPDVARRAPPAGAQCRWRWPPESSPRSKSPALTGWSRSARTSRTALVRWWSASEAKNRNDRSPWRKTTSTSPERRSTEAIQPGSAFTSRTTTTGPSTTITTVPAPATGITVGCTGGGSVTGSGAGAGGGGASVVVVVGAVVVVVGASVVVVVGAPAVKAARRTRRLSFTMSSDTSTLRSPLANVTMIQSGAIVFVSDVQPSAGATAATSRPDAVRRTVSDPASPAGIRASAPTASASKLAWGSDTSVAVAGAGWCVRWSVVSTPDVASAPARQVAPRTLAAISMVGVSFRRLRSGSRGPRSRRLRPAEPGGARLAAFAANLPFSGVRPFSCLS